MATLTGRTRYRVGFKKKLILQVEVKGKVHKSPFYYEDKEWWRDARLEDLEIVSKKDTQ